MLGLKIHQGLIWLSMFNEYIELNLVLAALSHKSFLYSSFFSYGHVRSSFTVLYP
jgi:hypothetical protein